MGEDSVFESSLSLILQATPCVSYVKEIEIEEQKAIALFDNGAYNTYVVKHLLNSVPVRKLPFPSEVGLGGDAIEVKESCIIVGKIEGYGFNGMANVVDEFGKIDGYKLDCIIGALIMEAWEITLNPRDGTLGLEGLKRRLFIEY